MLAWGNSLGDFVADVAVARGGEPKMAIAATFAGPLFNLLMGLGLSLLAGTLKTPNRQLNMGGTASKRSVVYACFGFLAASLVSSIATVAFCGFRFPRRHGWFLLALYVVFICTALSLQFWGPE